MELKQDHVVAAVRAGLELLGPDSEVQIPTRLNDGAFFLKGILGALAQGKLALTTPTEGAPVVAAPGEDLDLKAELTEGDAE